DVVGARPHQPPRVDGGVGHREGAGESGVKARLPPQRLGRADLLRLDPRLGARAREAVGILLVVAGRAHEEAAGVLDAVPRDPAQDAVLVHALPGRAGILHHVAAAGVEQPVEAARGALGEVVALDEDDAQPAQRGVAGDPDTGRTTPDDQHLRLDHRRTIRRDGVRAGAAGVPPPAPPPALRATPMELLVLLLAFGEAALVLVVVLVLLLALGEAAVAEMVGMLGLLSFGEVALVLRWALLLLALGEVAVALVALALRHARAPRTRPSRTCASPPSSTCGTRGRAGRRPSRASTRGPCPSWLAGPRSRPRSR